MSVLMEKMLWIIWRYVKPLIKLLLSYWFLRDLLNAVQEVHLNRPDMPTDKILIKKQNPQFVKQND